MNRNKQFFSRNRRAKWLLILAVVLGALAWEFQIPERIAFRNDGGLDGLGIQTIEAKVVPRSNGHFCLIIGNDVIYEAWIGQKHVEVKILKKDLPKDMAQRLEAWALRQPGDMPSLGSFLTWSRNYALTKLVNWDHDTRTGPLHGPNRESDSSVMLTKL